MTTIAVRGRVMAADTLVTSNGDWKLPGHEPKLHRLPDGGVVGFAGDNADGYAMIRWLQGERQGPMPKTRRTELLMLHPDGSVWVQYSPSMTPLRVYAEFYAIGSGRIPATAALYMGATPEQAVEVAMKLDTCTGGEVRSMSLP